MTVFKPTNQAGAAIQGGRNRVDGLQKLNELDKAEALALLSGLNANLRGVDGVPKHGVLKLLRAGLPEREDGALVRGREMDSNHLAQGKVPHVIGPAAI